MRGLRSGNLGCNGLNLALVIELGNFEERKADESHLLPSLPRQDIPVLFDNEIFKDGCILVEAWEISEPLILVGSLEFWGDEAKVVGEEFRSSYIVVLDIKEADKGLSGFEVGDHV